MAKARVRYWKEIPVRVQAEDGPKQVSQPLDDRRQSNTRFPHDFVPGAHDFDVSGTRDPRPEAIGHWCGQ